VASRFFGSIRQRVLFLFVSIVLIITVTILATVGILSRSLVKNLLEQNATSITQSYARSIHTWRGERIREMTQIASMDILKRASWEEIEPVLQQYMEDTDDYYRIYFVAEKDGSYNTTLQRSAGSIADRPYFPLVMQGETIVSEPLISRSMGEKIIVIATPIWNENETEVLRLLGLAVGLTEIYHTIADLQAEYPNWDISLVDENGLFVTHHNPDYIMTKSIYDFYPFGDDLLQGTAGTFTYVQDGTEYRSFFSEIPNTSGWMVVTRIPTTTYKQPFHRLVYFSLIATAIALLLVFRLGTWFADTITEPIVELKEIFRRGAEGDLTVRAEVATTDEFGDTRKFFNRMMDTIGTMTYLDPLTNLPNRDYLLSHLASCLTENPTVVLAIVGIRGLSELKTLLSADMLDRVLIKVADTLQGLGDGSAVVGRVSDGEFAIFTPSSSGGVLRIINRLNGLFSRPLEMENSDIGVRLFGGITISENRVTSAEVFFQQAQTALLDAEKDSSENIKLYNPDTHHAIVDRLRFQTEIQTALMRGQFVVYYQPIVSLASRTIVGKEALIRWEHPARGLLGPDEFLAAAEQGGFIEQIGEYMLEQVCAQHRAWQDQGLVMGWVSVNISAIQFRSTGLPQIVSSILEKYSLPTDLLHVEITEDAMLAPTPAVLSNLQSLREMGVSLAIDDFGTAYSSLEYLIRYPMEILKIDGTFISKVDHDERTEALVRSIIGMGKNLSMSIVAEGVERYSQLELLAKMHCTQAQGYYFSRPIPGKDYAAVTGQLVRKLKDNRFFP
jgi:EAL domain-containing protein (putative c-di-GMP-specific phosphodiesterase class I)/GGDEF domain-containing protein